tara:strand:+ start:230 stop:1057 length:828 start_codon:yes stop_codon:yes gene_type:complete
MKAIPTGGALGAEIEGIDLALELTSATVEEIRNALLEYGVIFFRDQILDVESHKRLARHFGKLFVHPFFVSGDDPEVLLIHRKPGDTSIVGFEWHSDTTMAVEPPMGSILYAVKAPPVGGDTLFADQYSAYEQLSDGMKVMLDGLRAVHSDRRVAGPTSGRNAGRTTKAHDETDWQETVTLHPVVRTHPETDRKCLYVNHSYTVGFENMTEEESKPLLEWLMNWGHRPELTCRFRWRDGSIAFWDNRCTKHLALDDVVGHDRIMRRVQIEGERPR